MALLLHGLPELAGQFFATVAGLEVARQVVGCVAFERATVWSPTAKWTLAAVVATAFAAAVESYLTPVVGETLLG